MPADLSGIHVLVRRACILREQQENEKAGLLEQNELGSAIRDLRLASGLEALTDAELKSIYAAEERRVADAAVLAALLVPRLVACLAPVGRSPQIPVLATKPEPAAPPPRPASANPFGGTPDIPDLLDAMLSSDRAAARRSAARTG